MKRAKKYARVRRIIRRRTTIDVSLPRATASKPLSLASGVGDGRLGPKGEVRATGERVCLREASPWGAPRAIPQHVQPSPRSRVVKIHFNP